MLRKRITTVEVRIGYRCAAQEDQVYLLQVLQEYETSYNKG